jgi:hypothetical protein
MRGTTVKTKMVENVCDKCPGNLRNPQSILSLDAFPGELKFFT